MGITCKGLDDSLKLLRIKTAQFFYTGIVVAVFHEESQGKLFGLGTCLCILIFNVPENFRHFLRQHHVGYFNGREEGGRKGAKIDYSVMLVQALHGRNGFAEVAELAVIIVFDDDTVVFNRPVEKLVTPADRHYSTGRELI